MLAAEAKKVKRVSEEARLILDRPPELEGWLESTEGRPRLELQIAEKPASRTNDFI